jgi:hypothetical protein
VTDPQVVARNRTEAFARRIRSAAEAIGHSDPAAVASSALNLASHAALAVALDARLINLMRINFFVDEERLPYWTEAPVLLWGLCREEGDGLYVMEGATRDLLLQRLANEYQPERVRKVATLLWQYAERERSWADRRELRHAQQLTALSWFDREQAQKWLDQAQGGAGEGSLSQEWFVAMREELPALPVLARDAGDPEVVIEALMRLMTYVVGLRPPIFFDAMQKVHKQSRVFCVAVQHSPEAALPWYLCWSMRVFQVSWMFEVRLSLGGSEDVNVLLRELANAVGGGRGTEPLARLAEVARAGRRVAFVLHTAPGGIREAALGGLREALLSVFRSSLELPLVVVDSNTVTDARYDLSMQAPPLILESAIERWLESERSLLQVPEAGLAKSIVNATGGSTLGVLEHLCRACGVRWKDVLACAQAPLIIASIQLEPIEEGVIRAFVLAYENATKGGKGSQSQAPVWNSMVSKVGDALLARPDWPVASYASSELEGDRLVAMMALQLRPDADWLEWLSKRVEQEQPFAARQALVALEHASKLLPDSDLPRVDQALTLARMTLIDQGVPTKSNRFNALVRAQGSLDERRSDREVVYLLARLTKTVVLPGTRVDVLPPDADALQRLQRHRPTDRNVVALLDATNTAGTDAGPPFGTVIFRRPTKIGYRATGLRRARIARLKGGKPPLVVVSEEPDEPHPVPAGFRSLLLDLNEALFEDREGMARAQEELDLALLCYWVAARLKPAPSVLQSLLEEPSVPVKLELVYSLLEQSIANLDPWRLDAGKRDVIHRALMRSDDERLRLSASRFASSAASRRKGTNDNHDWLKLWPNGATLRIQFLGGSSRRHGRVMRIASQWFAAANLHFEVLPRNSPTVGDIRIVFDANSGNWSYLGVDARSASPDTPTMNLGVLEPNDFEQRVLKQFGHALGLINEHQSPNVPFGWKEAAVLKAMTAPPLSWSDEQVRANILDRADASFAYREFDPFSVMIYHIPAHWTTTGQQCAPASKLTDPDLEFIAELYPRVQRTRSAQIPKKRKKK